MWKWQNNQALQALKLGMDVFGQGNVPTLLFKN